jgi:hypothetical protein
LATKNAIKMHETCILGIRLGGKYSGEAWGARPARLQRVKEGRGDLSLIFRRGAWESECWRLGLKHGLIGFGNPMSRG